MAAVPLPSRMGGVGGALIANPLQVGDQVASLFRLGHMEVHVIHRHKFTGIRQPLVE